MGKLENGNWECDRNLIVGPLSGDTLCTNCDTEIQKSSPSWDEYRLGNAVCCSAACLSALETGLDEYNEELE